MPIITENQLYRQWNLKMKNGEPNDVIKCTKFLVKKVMINVFIGNYPIFLS